MKMFNLHHFYSLLLSQHNAIETVGIKLEALVLVPENRISRF